MIIIDEAADQKLVRALKGPYSIGIGYCLHLYPITGVNAEHIRKQVIACAQQHLPGANMYVCEESGIFLLTQMASLKECKKTLLALSEALGVHPVERMGQLYDMAAQVSPLLMMLEKRIEERRKAEEYLLKQRMEEQAANHAARKRQQILDQGVRHDAAQIAALRRQRSEPVLMIIEDDTFSRRLVENVLQKQYEMHGLDSGDGALTTYADLAPDILFLDINLPDVTGHELLEKIITLDPKAYVVMISGNADKGNILQAMERGAVGFVAKPFSREKLFQYIERCPTITGKEKVQ